MKSIVELAEQIYFAHIAAEDAIPTIEAFKRAKAFYEEAKKIEADAYAATKKTMPIEAQSMHENKLATLSFAVLDGYSSSHGQPDKQRVEAIVRSILKPDVVWAYNAAAGDVVSAAPERKEEADNKKEANAQVMRNYMANRPAEYSIPHAELNMAKSADILANMTGPYESLSVADIEKVMPEEAPPKQVIKELIESPLGGGPISPPESSSFTPDFFDGPNVLAKFFESGRFNSASGRFSMVVKTDHDGYALVGGWRSAEPRNPFSHRLCVLKTVMRISYERRS